MPPPRAPTAPRPIYRRVRTIIEWMMAAIGLVILSPLMLLLGLIVKTSSPGPAFYSQIRLGRGGRHFRIYKFRTMTHNCESASGAIWARDNDPRITPLGRVLRDTHLDELPQLWNVLRGDMSLIGPRPERPELAEQIEKVVPDFAQRLSVRPGLTGLAQMRLPADRDVKRVGCKLAQDLYYIRNIGFGMDVRIMLSTIFVMVESACSAAARLSLGADNVTDAMSLSASIAEATSPTPGEESFSTDGERVNDEQPMMLAA